MPDFPARVYNIDMRKRSGFTLVELMVVVAVIVILAVITMLYMTKARANTRLARVSTELTEIATSLSQYADDNNFQYPADTSRSVPPGLEKYLIGGVWPESIWPKGVFDWENWVTSSGQQIYQMSYRLCDVDDPIASCSDPILFPHFQRNSSIFYCISGPCIPHLDSPTVPGYCVNCKPKEQNPPL